MPAQCQVARYALAARNAGLATFFAAAGFFDKPLPAAAFFDAAFPTAAFFAGACRTGVFLATGFLATGFFYGCSNGAINIVAYNFVFKIAEFIKVNN